MTLNREQIEKAESEPLSVVKVPVPEWNGHVFVRELYADEAERLELQMHEQRGKGRAKALLAVHCACDEDRKRIFRESDVNMLCRKSSKSLKRIADVAMRLNGYTDDDMETIEGNSEAVPSGSSG